MSSSTASAQQVVVVGAGLAGLALAALCARERMKATVLETHVPVDGQIGDPLASVNLALSARGLRTLEALGVGREVMSATVPMHGRRIHLPGGDEDFQPYDLVGRRAIHSIRRTDLWRSLHAAAERHGVDVRFDARCMAIDGDARTVSVANRRGDRGELSFDVLIGADGVHSMVRRSLEEGGQAVTESRTLRHRFLHLGIPVSRAAPLDRHALHIWPRGDHLLVALPNTDGSFTATLFFPEDAAAAETTSSRDGLQRLFHARFADAVPFVEHLAESLASHPIGRIFSTQCRPWSNAESMLLIGDAAHTMPPFYGQGMNCALEDCRVLMECVARHAPQWPRICQEFERLRRPDSDAITLLSERNYAEMSHHVTQSEFKHQRAIERALQLRYPDTFTPLYAMIAFSTVPYSQALARDAVQARLVRRLAETLDAADELDLEAEWVRAELDGNAVEPV